MNNLIIKICGITCPDVAKAAVAAGANLIGLVFHPGSPRYIALDLAVKVASAVREGGATPVAVFVNQNAEEMQKICVLAGIDRVQLHGEMARTQHHLLPADYQRIYVQTVSDKGELQHDVNIKNLQPECDLILVDHCDPGSGKTFPHDALIYDFPFRWLLAGGLHAGNVNNAIQKLQPHGVDVSSGVEVERGKKDIQLIQNFIDEVRHHATHKRSLR